jgi:hypothetical protein
MNVYLVKMRSRVNDEWFYKVGITHHEDIRLRFTTYGTETVHASNLPKMEKLRRIFRGETYIFEYDLDSVHVVKLARDADAEQIESEILEAVEGQAVLPQQPFPGRRECFWADDKQIGLVKAYMTDEANFHNSRSV